MCIDTNGSYENRAGNCDHISDDDDISIDISDNNGDDNRDEKSN